MTIKRTKLGPVGAFIASTSAMNAASTVTLRRFDVATDYALSVDDEEYLEFWRVSVGY
jgi:hypothetical protein